MNLFIRRWGFLKEKSWPKAIICVSRPGSCGSRKSGQNGRCSPPLIGSLIQIASFQFAAKALLWVRSLFFNDFSREFSAGQPNGLSSKMHVNADAVQHSSAAQNDISAGRLGDQGKDATSNEISAQFNWTSGSAWLCTDQFQPTFQVSARVLTEVR